MRATPRLRAYLRRFRKAAPPLAASHLSGVPAGAALAGRTDPPGPAAPPQGLKPGQTDFGNFGGRAALQ